MSTTWPFQVNQYGAINHEPAIMIMNTGNMNAGKPCLGSWLSYGLGSMNDNCPRSCAANQVEHERKQPARFIATMSSGFFLLNMPALDCAHPAIRLLFLTDPDGVSREVRRNMLDAVNEINRQTYEELGDPETNSRIAQYEMAYRMQSSVPNLQI